MDSGGTVAAAGSGGTEGRRREKHPRRRMVDAVFHLVRTGRSWRRRPKDFPPCPRVYWCFTRWHDDGAVERVHDALLSRFHEAGGSGPEPSAGPIDAQSVRTAGTVPAAARGFDVGKKVKGRKRSVVTEPPGPLLVAHVAVASVQDRDGARRPSPWIRLSARGEEDPGGPGFAGRRVDRWRSARILCREPETGREEPGRRDLARHGGRAPGAGAMDLGFGIVVICAAETEAATDSTTAALRVTCRVMIARAHERDWSRVCRQPVAAPPGGLRG
ncbi:transposase [Streptomyces sp. Act-28]